MTYDYLIVGAGLYGAVFAHELTKKGKKCLVIDRRDHIAGNSYTENVSGINVDKYKIAAYTLSGFFIGLSALFYAAVYSTITPGIGTGQEMQGITGVIVGGTSMAGGSGTMMGTLIGVFIMAVLKNGLPACGLQAPWQNLLTGVVVIGAVLLDIYRTKSAAKVKKS